MSKFLGRKSNHRESNASEAAGLLKPFYDDRDPLAQAQIPAVYRPYTRHIEQICQCESELFPLSRENGWSGG
ncbi:hypothetical protein NON20_11530 [Synechocystis sp. B12]|nr:hypothetical protein NON20_11530 [Synechocystis sp. B12]